LSFEFLVSVIQSLHHGARRSPFAFIEMVVTARTVGLVQHANGTNAESAARPRNGARQLLTAEKIDEGDKVVQTGGRAKDMRMQCLPSIARFRLMKAPCHSFPVDHAGLARRVRAPISTRFLFPQQVRQAVCPPTGI
jgi:hypothetical protein